MSAQDKDRVDYEEFCQMMNELKTSSPKKGGRPPRFASNGSSRSMSCQVSDVSSGKKDPAKRDSKRLPRQNSLGMMVEPSKVDRNKEK